MFKVKIIEVTEYTEKAPREWVKVADSGGDGYGEGPHAKYGYGPDSPNVVRRTREREVLTQEVATLDLPAVIKAINGL